MHSRAPFPQEIFNHVVSDFEIFLDKISSAVNRQPPKPEEKSKIKKGLMKKSKNAGKTLSAEADPLTGSRYKHDDVLADECLFFSSCSTGCRSALH